MNEETLTPEEKIEKAKATLKRKTDKLQYIKQRIASAKKANNKIRIKIAKLDYEMCKLDIEKYKKKIEKEKLRLD